MTKEQKSRRARRLVSYKEFHARNREKRNAYTRMRRRSVDGHIRATYGHMNDRVSGASLKRSIHLYRGLEIMPRDEFYKWAKNLELLVLHRQWVRSGYDRRLTPSINRIDNSKGYIAGNLEWITKSANSTLGCIARWTQNKKKKDAVSQCIERVINAA